MTETPQQQETPTSTSPLQLLRSVLPLIAVLAITVWSFTAWPLPWPGILTGVLALALTVVLWALFLSPKPVLRTDRFGQTLIDLLLVGGASGAMLAMGVTWVVVVPYFVVAAALAYAGSALQRA